MLHSHQIVLRLKNYQMLAKDSDPGGCCYLCQGFSLVCRQEAEEHDNPRRGRALADTIYSNAGLQMEFSSPGISTELWISAKFLRCTVGRTVVTGCDCPGLLGSEGACPSPA